MNVTSLITIYRNTHLLEVTDVNNQVISINEVITF
jgi:hypothetical protein